MKVNNQIPVQSQSVEKSQQAQPSQKSQSRSALNSAPSDRISGASVDISPEAQMMKQAGEIAKSSPDMRLEKVAQLKKAIQEGTYQIESSKIADKLVDEHFKSHFGKNHF